MYPYSITNTGAIGYQIVGSPTAGGVPPMTSTVTSPCFVTVTPGVWYIQATGGVAYNGTGSLNMGICDQNTPSNTAYNNLNPLYCMCYAQIAMDNYTTSTMSCIQVVSTATVSQIFYLVGNSSAGAPWWTPNIYATRIA
jgi:hypothetical protein